MTFSVLHNGLLSSMSLTLLYTVRGVVHTWELKNLQDTVIGKAVAYSPQHDRTFEVQALAVSDHRYKHCGLEKLMLNNVLDVLFRTWGSPVYLYIGANDDDARAMCEAHGGTKMDGGSNDELHRYIFHSEAYIRKAA